MHALRIEQEDCSERPGLAFPCTDALAVLRNRMGVPNHSELKNTANFPQTVSHTVREDFVEKRKRR